MDTRIVITDGTQTVVLKNKLIFTNTIEEVSTTATMAGGNIVKDIIGYRNVLNVPCGYLSSGDLLKLRNMILTNAGFLTITYPTIKGMQSERFVVDMPVFKTFKYSDDGVEYWYGVTLTCRGEAVMAS